jgi:hypothetical protein
LQIIARDTVIIEEGAELRYPSGVYLKGDREKVHLSIGAHSRLEGYAVVVTKSDDTALSGLNIPCNYRQDESAGFRGLLYVDGTADIRGTLSGGIYLTEGYYLPPGGIYAGTVYNARIGRDSIIAYPLLLRDNKEKRREIKTMKIQ